MGLGIRLLVVVACGCACGVVVRGAGPRPPVVRTADSCVACHNGISAASGEDVSIGPDWRASMMANSSRDPYWQAAVRREITDHPAAAASVEDTCATCHMPMSRIAAVAAGRKGSVFAHLPTGRRGAAADRLAHDGVSCTVCHQIAADKLGMPETSSGRFTIEQPRASHSPISLGPFAVDDGRAAVMESASAYRPVEAAHVRSSELCATCHTLYITALGPDGAPAGRLPEQMSFLEWRHSAFREEQSCQGCHMPAVRERAPIASVLGTPRDGVARHVFRGGNFFVLRMLNRYGRDLGVAALPAEVDAAERWTTQQLQSDTAQVAVERVVRTATEVAFDVTVRNLTGHKLPTGFPSRRAWLHVAVRGSGGRIVFDSGALAADGRIEGNDNDDDPRRFEPHFTEIRRGGDVQIYESIVGDKDGGVTTGLLRGTRYLKDNRLLPRGFDKRTADADIEVVGSASTDADFGDGGDRVRYAVDVGSAEGPLQIDVELRYQPIGFRWAANLDGYPGMEPRRFVEYFNSMAGESSTMLAHASAVAR